MFERSHPKQIAVSRSEISDARFKRFLRDLSDYERKVTFEETLNAFLDLYSTWMKTRESKLKIRLVMLAFELCRLDPTFTCTLAFSD